MILLVMVLGLIAGYYLTASVLYIRNARYVNSLRCDLGLEMKPIMVQLKGRSTRQKEGT